MATTPPEVPLTAQCCCERAHVPSIAFPSVKWHRSASSSDGQQRDVFRGPRNVPAVASFTNVGWPTCSRTFGPFAIVTSTRNSHQVAVRTTPGLLMQPTGKRSAPPYRRTDLRVMIESLSNEMTGIKPTTKTCDASACSNVQNMSYPRGLLVTTNRDSQKKHRNPTLTRPGEHRRRTKLRNCQHPMGTSETVLQRDDTYRIETRDHNQPLAPSQWLEMN